MTNKNNIIEPFKSQKGISKIQKAKEYLLSFFDYGILYIILNEKEIFRIDTKYLSKNDLCTDVYQINNCDFVNELFESEIFEFIKDIKIFGIRTENKFKFPKIDETLKLRKFHSNRKLIEIVDLYFYSENFFETMVLIE